MATGQRVSAAALPLNNLTALPGLMRIVGTKPHAISILYCNSLAPKRGELVLRLGQACIHRMQRLKIWMRASLSRPDVAPQMNQALKAKGRLC